MQFFVFKKVEAATNTQKKKLPSSSIIHTKVQSSQNKKP